MRHNDQPTVVSDHVSMTMVQCANDHVRDTQFTLLAYHFQYMYDLCKYSSHLTQNSMIHI
jgi:hypothetical protein